jgi:hypothetical protein
VEEMRAYCLPKHYGYGSPDSGQVRVVIEEKAETNSRTRGKFGEGAYILVVAAKR